MKLETAPAEGPWPQAARAWMELGLSGSATCPRCPVLCSCCLPCLKGQTQLTLHHPAAHSRPTLAVTAAPGDGISPPGIGWARNAHCTAPVITLRRPALPAALRLPPPAIPGSRSSVWAAVGPSGASKPGIAISCRQANQPRQAGTLGGCCSALLWQNYSKMAEIATGKLDTHPNGVSELFKAVRSYSDRCRCPRDLISGRF